MAQIELDLYKNGLLFSLLYMSYCYLHLNMFQIRLQSMILKKNIGKVDRGNYTKSSNILYKNVHLFIFLLKIDK